MSVFGIFCAIAVQFGQESGPTVEVVPLGDGVYAALRREPLSLAGNANSLIVVGDREVLVVDAQFTREATQETLAAIRSVTPLPVRFVVNTHWHDDHFAGNQVYRDSFPEVEFLAHANTRADLVTLGRPNRDGTRAGAPPLIVRYERLLAQGLGVDSTPVSALEHESLTHALRIMKQYLSELDGFRETLPGPSLQDHMQLRVGKHDVRIHWFGRANTRGDLVVQVASAGVVATGDLVVWPVPFAFGSNPKEWIPVLDSVAALRPRVMVPGHGPLMRDQRYLRQVRAMLVDATTQSAAAHLRGDSLSKALRDISLANHRRAIAGDDKWLNYMFTNFFLTPVIRSAMLQEQSERR